MTTGAFPGSEIDTRGEMVQLTEPANVLGILFTFVYPKAHPDLRGEGFEVLAAVAEAVGKYGVFSAVTAGRGQFCGPQNLRRSECRCIKF